MVVDRESRRALDAVRRAILASPLSQRRVEKRAGFSRGYLSQLLAGNLDLKLGHLLAMLEALELPPGRFFSGLFPDNRRAALAAFRARSQRGEVEAPRDMAALHDLGLESLAALRGRLERCERAIAELEDLGILDLPKAPSDPLPINPKLPDAVSESMPRRRRP